MAALSACSSVDLGQADRLASSGSRAAGAAREATEATRNDLVATLRIETIRAAVEPGISPPSEAMKQSIGTIRDELALRAAMFGTLEDLYGAFGDLASYDASKEFSSAASQTRGAINAFATKLGQAAPFGEATGKLIDTGFGFMGEELQKSRVNKASAIVRESLEPIVQLLEDPKDRAANVRIRQAAAEQYSLGAKALWNAGILSAGDRMTDLVRIEGLTIRKDASVTADNQRFKAAVAADIDQEIDARLELEEQSYQQTIDALKALISAHKALEAGQPMTLDRLAAEVGRLVALAGELKGNSSK